VVRSWHDQYLPGHFTLEGRRQVRLPAAEGRQRAAAHPCPAPPRSGQTYRTYRSNPHYSWRKRRQKGHNKPLVWSGHIGAGGQAIREALGPQDQGRRRDQSHGGDDEVATTSTQFRKDLGQPDKADELTRVTPGEVLSLQGIYQTSFDANLTALTAAADRGAVQTIA
jgi:hypothetical protein